MNAIILFTRVPIPGHTKTRLEGFLSKEQCAELHRHMLADIASELDKSNTPCFAYITPDREWERLEGCLPKVCERRLQTGESLGDRMKNAIAEVLALGHEKVVLIGSDVPDLQVTEILEAFLALDRSDIVLGPVEDGGYFFIGMKSLFYDPFGISAKWGSESVYEATVAHLKEQGTSVASIGLKRDLDTEEDLRKWVNRPGTKSTRTDRLVRRWLNERR